MSHTVMSEKGFACHAVSPRKRYVVCWQRLVLVNFMIPETWVLWQRGGRTEGKSEWQQTLTERQRGTLVRMMPAPEEDMSGCFAFVDGKVDGRHKRSTAALSQRHVSGKQLKTSEMLSTGRQGGGWSARLIRVCFCLSSCLFLSPLPLLCLSVLCGVFTVVMTLRTDAGLWAMQRLSILAVHALRHIRLL